MPRPDDVELPRYHGGRRRAVAAAEDPDEFTDDELTALAMAADPNPTIPDDAVPFGTCDEPVEGLLPDWYMPAPGSRPSAPRTVVLAGVAVALFVINVGGVCVTYGIPDPVWK